MEMNFNNVGSVGIFFFTVNQLNSRNLFLSLTFIRLSSASKGEKEISEITPGRESLLQIFLILYNHC
jgi:hypothetical protein